MSAVADLLDVHIFTHAILERVQEWIEHERLSIRETNGRLIDITVQVTQQSVPPFSEFYGASSWMVTKADPVVTFYTAVVKFEHGQRTMP